MATGGQVAEARVHSRTGGFTIIDNGIFKDRTLSLKAKGLLCTVLSLPPEWDYSIRGLLKIINPSHDGKLKPLQGQSRDGLYATLSELEKRGYLIREQTRDENGKLGKLLYHFFDAPQSRGAILPSNAVALPRTASSTPHTENPDTAKSRTENPPQLSTYSKKELKEINHSSSPAPGERNEEGDDEAFNKAFDRLCLASLKRPSPTSLVSVRQAFRERVKQGYSYEQMEKAYRSYISRYKERNDDPRYAKQLIDWLTQNDGLAWDAGTPTKKRLERQARKREQEAEKETELRLNNALKKADPVFKAMSDEFMELIGKGLRTRGDERAVLDAKIRELSEGISTYLQSHRSEALAALHEEAKREGWREP